MQTSLARTQRKEVLLVQEKSIKTLTRRETPLK